MKRLVASTLVLVAAQALALDPNTAFQQGKDLANSYKDMGKQQAVINAAPTTVPGYGASRQEENLFGTAGLTGPASARMSSCAANPRQDGSVQNHMECEGVNFLAKRPAQQSKTAFPNIKNDPAVAAGAYVSGNLESIARNLGINQGGVANQCKTVTVTDPAQYVDRHCIEGYEVKAESCVYGRKIVIDADSNYQCDKTLASKEVFDCSKKWICEARDGCDSGGINPGSISATLRYDWRAAGGGDFYMEIGNVQDNIYGWGFHKATAYFDVVDPARITKFILEWAAYDDYIWVKLNDQTVWVGPDGGDRLESCCLYTITEGECLSQGVTEDGVTCRPFERYGPHDVKKGGITINKDVRHLLRKGQNKIWMQIAVGGRGDMVTRWRTRQLCPPNCYWLDQCANMIK
jgi:hypothetical protein